MKKKNEVYRIDIEIIYVSKDNYELVKVYNIIYNSNLDILKHHILSEGLFKSFFIFNSQVNHV